MFFGFDAKNTLQTNRNEWSKGFESKFIDDKFLHELCRHILDNYRDQLKKILKDEKLMDLFEFCLSENKNKTSWKGMKMFNIENFKDYKSKNNKCLIYDKSFAELLTLDNFNFYHVDNFVNSNVDEMEFFENDLVYPNSFNGWFKEHFDQEWIDKGGFIFNEKINGREVVRYTKEKYDGVDDNEMRILNKIKIAIQTDRKRINFNDEWLDENFFKEYAPLFTKSILVERLVGLEHLNVRHLILPFYIFSKDLEKKPNLRIDYLDNNDLVRFSWEARVEEYEDKTLEFYQKLYQGLEEKIMKLVEAVYPDWIQK